MLLLSANEAADIAGANAALEGVRTFFTVIAALVFGFFGLTFITAAFIVPKAAQQLETDTKRLRPGLWEEYEAKLNKEAGETMATRPDLLQELGNIMQPIIIKDFEDSANAKQQGTTTTTTGPGETIITDATIVETRKDTTPPPKQTLGDADQWKD